jgi:hypothetical protein
MGNSKPVEAGPHEQDLPRKTSADSQAAASVIAEEKAFCDLSCFLLIQTK